MIRHPNLNGWFRFDGDLSDSSGNGALTAYSGTATYSSASGGQGQMLTMSSVNGACARRSSEVLSNVRKLSCGFFVKNTNAALMYPINIETNNTAAYRFYIRLYTAGGLEMVFGDGGGGHYLAIVDTTAYIPNGVMSHLGVVVDLDLSGNERIKVYLNGNLLPLTLTSAGTVVGVTTDSTYYLAAGGRSYATQIGVCPVNEVCLLYHVALSQANMKRMALGFHPIQRS